MARRLALALLVLAAASALVWFAFPEYVPAGLRARLDGVPGATSTTAAPSARDNPPLYKWRDDQGVWNITDRPPADRPYERVVVDPNQNVVPTVVPPWAQSIQDTAKPEQNPPPR